MPATGHPAQIPPAERLEWLFNAANVLIAELDREGRITRINPKACQLIGLASAELEGRHLFREFVAPPAPTEASFDVYRSLAEGTCQNVRQIEAILLGTIGEHCISWELTCLHTEQAECCGSLAIGQDISALRASENRFRDFTETGSDWLWETDAQHRFSFLSENSVRIVGPEYRSLLGKTRLEIAERSARAANREHWERHLADLAARRPFSRFEYLAGYPIVRWFSVSGKPVFARDGTFLGYRGIGCDVSDRHHVEEALRASEAFNRDTLDSITSHVAVLSPNGFIVAANRAWLEFAGKTATIGNGQSGIGLDYVAEWEHLADNGDPIGFAAAQGVRAVLRGESENFSLDYICRLPDDTRWFRMRATPLRSGTGAVVAHEDITDVYHARKQRDAIASRLELATQAAGIGLWEWQSGDEHYHWDSTMFSLHGLPPDRQGVTLGEWLERLHPQDRSIAMDSVRAALRSGGEITAEFRIVKPDGGIRWLRLIGIALNREGKRITHLLGGAWDITRLMEAQQRLEQLNRHLEARVAERTLQLEGARKTALEMMHKAKSAQSEAEYSLQKLSESTLRLRVLSSAVEQSPVAMLITDCDGAVEYVNPKFEQLTGYAAKELLGHRPGRSGANSMLGDFFGTLWSTISAGREWGGEIRNRRSNGEQFWAHTSISPVKSNDGRISGFIAIVEDVTEKRAAADMLLHAKEAADAANRAKSEFLANMSHEIRTPMNVIIGMTYLAQHTALTPQQRDYIDSIHHSGQHLLGIVDDILDFSKIEAGKLEIESMDFELDTVLDGLANLLGSKASAKNLELLFDIDPRLTHFLRGDPLRIEQVLINYTNNAIKFTEHGTVIVRVRRIDEDPQEVRVRFEVEDTGIGMDEAQTARLFQSFQQADSSTTRKFGGSGLGLAICRRLVDLMDGEVGVSSEAGKGSTFWFSVRLGKGQAVKQQTLPENLRQSHLLVVDDQDAARTLIAEMLSHLGFRVETASSGEEAIGMVCERDSRADPYAIVFLDWKMPEPDGMETARRLSALPLRALPPRILVTCPSQEEIVRDAGNAAISSFVIKPVTPSSLLDAISRAVSTVATLGAPPDQAPPAEQSEHRIKDARLLLVEDNPFNQQVAREILEEAGARVWTATHGREALDALAREPFDCVLMDVQMPIMDGFEATRRIRSLAEHGDLPIIAMTANAFAQDREDCLAAGMNDYITKPIHPDKLFARLEYWLGNRPTLEETTAPPRAPFPLSSDPGATPSGDPGHIDLSVLARMVSQDPARIEKFARKFLDAAASTHAEMLHELQEGRYETLRSLGHRLKASARTVGALAFGDLCERIERMERPEAASRENDPRRMVTKLGEAIEPLTRSVEQQLSAFREEWKTP